MTEILLWVTFLVLCLLSWQVRRDPRFDDLSGQYNEAAFNSNYSFMEGVRRRELTVTIIIVIIIVSSYKAHNTRERNVLKKGQKRMKFGVSQHMHKITIL